MLKTLAIFFIGALVALAADTLGAGSYKGSWIGNSGSGGDFHLTLKPGADGQLAADIGFSLGGENVKCAVSSLKIDGGDLDMVYTFELQGNKLQSAIKGTLKGKALEGTYKTTTPDGGPVDEGAWKTAIE